MRGPLQPSRGFLPPRTSRQRLCQLPRTWGMRAARATRPSFQPSRGFFHPRTGESLRPRTLPYQFQPSRGFLPPRTGRRRKLSLRYNLRGVSYHLELSGVYGSADVVSTFEGFLTTSNAGSPELGSTRSPVSTFEGIVTPSNPLTKIYPSDVTTFQPSRSFFHPRTCSATGAR